MAPPLQAVIVVVAHHTQEAVRQHALGVKLCCQPPVIITTLRLSIRSLIMADPWTAAGLAELSYSHCISQGAESQDGSCTAGCRWADCPARRMNHVLPPLQQQPPHLLTAAALTEALVQLPLCVNLQAPVLDLPVEVPQCFGVHFILICQRAMHGCFKSSDVVYI